MSNTNTSGKKSGAVWNIKSAGLATLIGASLAIVAGGAAVGYYQGKGAPLDNSLENILLYLPSITSGTSGAVSAARYAKHYYPLQTAKDYGRAGFVTGLGAITGAAVVGTLTTVGYLTGKGLSYLF